jgi:hypothetical protein
MKKKIYFLAAALLLQSTGWTQTNTPKTIERCFSDATWQESESEYAGRNLRSRSSNG